MNGRGIQIEGQPRPVGEDSSADLYVVTPDYMTTMSIQLMKGRTLTDQDTENSPQVALINETMAKEIWPGQDAIGKRIKFSSETESWRTVVGVVSDVRHYALDKSAPTQFYLPQAQYPNNGMSLVVRTSSDPAPMLDVIRKEVRAIDKDMFISDITTMDQLVSQSISLRRFSMSLLGLFAATALILSSIGIYGVISYSVTQRYQEIGVRIALGAKRSDILGIILTQGMILVGIGAIVGLTGAYLLTSAMSALLYEVSATDIFTFAVVTTILVGVALFACLIPARRATKIDPITALRYE